MSPAGASVTEHRPLASQPLPFIRETVRTLLLSAPAYQALDPTSRRQMAELMVRVCQTAAALLLEEIASEEQVQQAHAQAAASRPASVSPRDAAPLLAVAQSAGSDFSGVSAARVAGTTQAILNAVSFPRFVTELINGVFKAMIDTS